MNWEVWKPINPPTNQSIKTKQKKYLSRVGHIIRQNWVCWKLNGAFIHRKREEGLLSEGIWVSTKVLNFPENTKPSYSHFFQGESWSLNTSGEGLWDAGGEGKSSQEQVTPKGNLSLTWAVPSGSCMESPICISFSWNLSTCLPYAFLTITPLYEMILWNVIFMTFIKNSVPLDERCCISANINNAEMYNVLQGVLTFTA